MKLAEGNIRNIIRKSIKKLVLENPRSYGFAPVSGGANYRKRRGSAKIQINNKSVKAYESSIKRVLKPTTSVAEDNIDLFSGNLNMALLDLFMKSELFKKSLEDAALDTFPTAAPFDSHGAPGSISGQLFGDPKNLRGDPIYDEKKKLMFYPGSDGYDKLQNKAYDTEKKDEDTTGKKYTRAELNVYQNSSGNFKLALLNVILHAIGRKGSAKYAGHRFVILNKKLIIYSLVKNKYNSMSGPNVPAFRKLYDDVETINEYAGEVMPMVESNSNWWNNFENNLKSKFLDNIYEDHSIISIINYVDSYLLCSAFSDVLHSGENNPLFSGLRNSNVSGSRVRMKELDSDENKNHTIRFTSRNGQTSYVISIKDECTPETENEKALQKTKLAKKKPKGDSDDPREIGYGFGRGSSR